MRNDILDNTEPYTGPRTCPNCGFQFPFGLFVRRYILSFGLSEWSCQGCQVPIKCDFIKVQVLWLIGLVPFGLLYASLSSYFNSALLDLVLMLPFFAFVLLTFYFAKFEKQA